MQEEPVMLKLLAIIGFGALVGMAMGYFGKCTSGACPLTANPFRGAGFGALIGLLVVMSQGGGRLFPHEPHAPSPYIRHVPDLVALEALLATSQVPVLIDFFADWCGPCRRLAPELAALAEAWKDNAIVIKVNVDNQPDMAEHFRVSAIPDMRVFVGGKQRDAVVGFRPKDELHAILVAAGGRD
jgi:thioredoxin 1